MPAFKGVQRKKKFISMSYQMTLRKQDSSCGWTSTMVIQILAFLKYRSSVSTSVGSNAFTKVALLLEYKIAHNLTH